MVIAADDPRLIGGWHHAEREGADLWRWTDGSAELPWNGVSGPAVVTVHCTTLTEYPIRDETVRHRIMSDIRTVGIGELAPACVLAEAVHSWRGFAELAPASLRRAAMPYLILPNAPDGNWTWNRVPDCPLAPIGCSFLRDLEVSGSGYLFREGRFVREFVNISDVALQWLRQPDFFDNPLTHPRTNRVVLDEPALLVFGPRFEVFTAIGTLLDFMPRRSSRSNLWVRCWMSSCCHCHQICTQSGWSRMVHTFCRNRTRPLPLLLQAQRSAVVCVVPAFPTVTRAQRQARRLHAARTDACLL